MANTVRRPDVVASVAESSSSPLSSTSLASLASPTSTKQQQQQQQSGSSHWFKFTSVAAADDDNDIASTVVPAAFQTAITTTDHDDVRDTTASHPIPTHSPHYSHHHHQPHHSATTTETSSSSSSISSSSSRHHHYHPQERQPHPPPATHTDVSQPGAETAATNTLSHQRSADDERAAAATLAAAVSPPPPPIAAAVRRSTDETPTTAADAAQPQTHSRDRAKHDGSTTSAPASVGRPPVVATRATTVAVTTRVSTAVLPPTFNTSRIYDRVAAERERVRAEFYATYDVMTGVRIAATLGGFFALMVFLVVYKSRGESQETIKALKDPKIAAVAAAVMQEEEDRELQEAMEATGMSIYPDEYEYIGYGQRQRMMSLGNISAPPVFGRGQRLASIGSAYGLAAGGVGPCSGSSGVGGGYSNLLSPTRRRRFSYSESGRNSVSASSRVLSGYALGGSFGIGDYFAESDGDDGDGGDEADDEFDALTTASQPPPPLLSSRQRLEANGREQTAARPSLLLAVPQQASIESRRSSNITCCSTESSFLERRCSDVTLGLTPLTSVATPLPSRRQAADPAATATSLFLPAYPGIQVQQPTPRHSPEPMPAPSATHQHHQHHQHHHPKLPPTVALRSKSLSLEHQPHSLDTISAYTSSSGGGSSPTQSKVVVASTPTPLISMCVDEPPQPPKPLSSSSFVSSLQLSDVGAGRAQSSRSVASTQMATTTFSCQPPPQAASPAAAAVRRAPLASISSFKISSLDYQDSDLKSLGSDSLFADSCCYYADTDDEMQSFSTDSEDLTTAAGAPAGGVRRSSVGGVSRQQLAASPSRRRVLRTHPAAQPVGTSACSVVNEVSPRSPASAPARTAAVAARRILQRSSTIFPSAESLRKAQQNSAMPADPAEARASCVATVEPYPTPPSTRSLPAVRPVGTTATGSASRVVRLLTPPSMSAASAPAANVRSRQRIATNRTVDDDHAAVPLVSLGGPPNGARASAATQQATTTTTFASDPSLPPGAARKWSKETLF